MNSDVIECRRLKYPFQEYLDSDDDQYDSAYDGRLASESAADLSAEEQDIVENCACAEDIPESVMESAYGIYDFVEGDFFCNVEDQFCDKLGNDRNG